MAKHSLPELPYAYDALEPYIDAKTMEIHHSKHHAAYVAKLNAALEQARDFENLDVNTLLTRLNDIPEAARNAIRNNGGGTANHNFFWKLMGPGKGGKPKGGLADAITQAFGSFEAFREKFSNEAVNRFGSGWAWLSREPNGKLIVHSTPNQDSPLSEGRTPILTLDVWEHAYYLKYQNRRPEYIEAWWSVINWDVVAENFESSRR